MSEAIRLKERATELADRIDVLRDEIGHRIIGQKELIGELLVGILAGGHILLEGLPGLGKTLLAHCVAQGMGLHFRRLQFTPDLMPADVTGTRIVDDRGPERQFRFEPGPLFGNLVLGDEINRATPRTQSALLEAMQEGAVTVAGETHQLPRPFTVVATQNPIELEGTYPLPEAQLDRFMFKLLVRTPPVADMVNILGSTTGRQTEETRAVFGPAEVLECGALAREVIAGDHLVRYVAELLHATHPDHEGVDDQTRRFVRYGASARAGQAVILGAKVRALMDRRPSIAIEDLQACLLPALCHRVVLSFEAEAEGVKIEDLLPAWREAARKKTR